jgi:hypothetical protein
MSKNMTQLSFNPPPLVTQPRFNQPSINNYPPPPPPKFNPPPPPPKINNYPPPPPPRFNPPPLLRQPGYNENKISYNENHKQSYKSISPEIDYIFYFYIFLLIVFILGLIMLVISYFNLNRLRQNNKNNSQKDVIEKWNKVFVVSTFIVVIPLIILISTVCFKSPLSCMAFAMIR